MLLSKWRYWNVMEMKSVQHITLNTVLFSSGARQHPLLLPGLHLSFGWRLLLLNARWKQTNQPSLWPLPFAPQMKIHEQVLNAPYHFLLVKQRTKYKFKINYPWVYVLWISPSLESNVLLIYFCSRLWALLIDLDPDTPVMFENHLQYSSLEQRLLH